jgi:hypothetical protein
MLLKNTTETLQRISDEVVCGIVEDFVLDADKLDPPVVLVYSGNRLPGDDKDCIGVYDPEANEILVTVPEGSVYEEYRKFSSSPVIGNYTSKDSNRLLRVLLLHELAHWMVDHVMKKHTHKHNKIFKVCYAYLREKYRLTKS